MEALEIFKNNQFGEIRATIDKNGNPLFCLTDVAKSLGYTNPQKAVRDHCKGVNEIDTPTLNQHSATVMQKIKYGKEREVYRLIMRSKLPDAELFQDWIYDDVIPSIRKYGVFMSPDTIERTLTDPDFIIQLATNLKEEKEKKELYKTRSDFQEKKLKLAAPKILFAEAVSKASTNVSVEMFAKLISSGNFIIGRNKLFQWFVDNDILFFKTYTTGKGRQVRVYRPYQKYMKYFNVSERTVFDYQERREILSTTVYVTGKGQTYLTKKIYDSFGISQQYSLTTLT